MTETLKKYIKIFFVFIELIILIVSIDIFTKKALTYIFNWQVYLDDSFMFIRYAKNFLSGLGHAWNPDGTQIYGNTSLLHFFITVFNLIFLPKSISEAGIVVISSAFIGIMSLLVLILLCAKYTFSKVLKNNYFLFAAIIFLTITTTHLWNLHLVSGMDTMTSIFAISIFVYSVIRWDRLDKRQFLPAIFGYIAFLARPDNAIYAIGFPVLYILLISSRNNRFRRCGEYLLIFSVIILIDFSVKYIILGDILPLSFYAKKSGYLEGYAGAAIWNPFEYLRIYFDALMPFIFIMILFAKKELIITFLLPVILTILYYFSFIQIMGDGARFYYSSLPFFVIGGVLLLDDFLKRIETNGFKINIFVTGRIAVAILFFFIFNPILLNLGKRYEKLYAKVETVDIFRNDYFTIKAKEPLPDIRNIKMVGSVGVSLISNLPAGTTVALSEHGYIGAVSIHINIIDLVALHDKIFAHKGFTAQELFNRKPDLIWGPHPHYTSIVKKLYSSKQFWDDYIYYPGAFNFGFAIRKDSPKYKDISRIFQGEWEKNYKNINANDYLATPNEKIVKLAFDGKA